MDLNVSANHTPRVKLDEIDLKILHDLQVDGRMTNAELARRYFGATLSQARTGIEESGLSAATMPIWRPSLGYNVTVFAQVGLHSQAEPDLVAFETLINGWPEVRECHMLAGETDFLLKIVAADWETYQASSRKS